MSSWFIDSLILTFSIGLVAFVNKVFAQRKYDQRAVAIVLYGFMSLLAIGYGMWHGLAKISIKDFLLIVLAGLEFYGYSIVMMSALRYLPTSVYFINVRLLSSFALLFIGIIFFQDQISLAKWIGFFVGAVAMVLLFERDEQCQKVDYKKGIPLLLLGAGLLVMGHFIVKLFTARPEVAPTFFLIAFGSSFLFAILFGYKTILKNRRHLSEIIKINFIQAILFFYYFTLLFKVYNSGALGISYKIQSYSPFIPIILSAIIYKEKISWQKKIALVLVAISLWFFK